MTRALSGQEVARSLGEKLPEAIVDSNETTLWVEPEALFEAARLLKDTLALDYLTDLTAVDYPEYFEVVYHLCSIENNHSIVLKTRCYDRENPTVPSVVGLWRGADLQEREVYDLMGISFSGHPNLKRIFLWEGFQGHPLRKDYIVDSGEAE